MPLHSLTNKIKAWSRRQLRPKKEQISQIQSMRVWCLVLPASLNIAYHTLSAFGSLNNPPKLLASPFIAEVCLIIMFNCYPTIGRLL